MGEGDIVIHRSSSHKSCLIWKNELRDDGGGSGIRSVSKRKRFDLYRMSPISVDNEVWRPLGVSPMPLLPSFPEGRTWKHLLKAGGCGRANQRFRGTEMGICKCVKRVGLIPIHGFQMLNGRSVWGTNWVVSFSSSIRMRIPNWFVERLTTTTFFRRGTEG